MTRVVVHWMHFRLDRISMQLLKPQFCLERPITCLMTYLQSSLGHHVVCMKHTVYVHNADSKSSRESLRICVYILVYPWQPLTLQAHPMCSRRVTVASSDWQKLFCIIPSIRKNLWKIRVLSRKQIFGGSLTNNGRGRNAHYFVMTCNNVSVRCTPCTCILQVMYTLTPNIDIWTVLVVAEQFGENFVPVCSTTSQRVHKGPPLLLLSALYTSLVFLWDKHYPVAWFPAHLCIP